MYSSCRNINILIKSVGKSIFIARAGSTANNAATALISGYPQVLLMSPDQVQKFTSVATCGNYTDVVVTMLTGDIPQLTVTPSGRPAVASNSGFLTFKNPQSSKGSATSIVAVDKNATIASILIREQSGNDKCPVHLPNGAAQRDRIATVGGQQFYIFQVPAGISGGVTISLEATQVRIIVAIIVININLNMIIVLHYRVMLTYLLTLPATVSIIVNRQLTVQRRNGLHNVQMVLI